MNKKEGFTQSNSTNIYEALRKQETNKIPKKKIVAIPCYNEEKTIGSIVLKAKKYADEILIVDDGSVDKTAEIAECAGATVMQHGGNKGYGAAIKSCFKYARESDCDLLTIIDGDGQHDTDQLISVMKPVIENNADISIGSRFLDENKESVPKYRRIGIWVINKFTNAGSKKMMHKVKDTQSGFRAYSKKAIQTLNLKEDKMGVSAEILMQGRKHNLIFTEVPISISYEGDTSTEGPINHGFGVIISILKYLEVEHSLLFFGIPGIILFCLGMIFGVDVYLTYESHGFLNIGPTLVTIIFLFLGAISGMTALILHAVVNAQRRR